MRLAWRKRGGTTEKLFLVAEGGQLGVGHNSRLRKIIRGRDKPTEIIIEKANKVCNKTAWHLTKSFTCMNKCLHNNLLR